MSQENVRTPTRYVLLAANRSGSSWLMEMLNSHPAIGGYGELFSPRYSSAYPETRAALYADPGGVPFFGAYLSEQRLRPRSALMPYLGVKYMERVYAPREGLDAVGFRLMYRDFRRTWGIAAWLVPYLAARRVRVVHLVRRNGLDLLVSREMGASRNVWHVKNGDAVAPATIRINTEELVRQLDWHEEKQRRARRVISLLRLPSVEIGYEDLVADTNGEYRRVVEFLGAQPVEHEPQWRMRKVIDTPREETIENYESVKRALERTKYASLLEE